jgi:receptor expression-enhancing protein 5/6
MENIQTQFKSYNSKLDKELSKYSIFNTIEKRTNVPKTYLALGAGAFMFVLIFFDFAGQLLSNLVGWVYPAYRSFKAIETTEKTDDTQWLTYWYVVHVTRLWLERILAEILTIVYIYKLSGLSMALLPW